MFSFVHDFSGDGRLDILVLGRIHKHPAYWYENPGDVTQPWPQHFAFQKVCGESPALVSLRGDAVEAGDLSLGRALGLDRTSAETAACSVAIRAGWRDQKIGHSSIMAKGLRISTTTAGSI